MAHIRQMHTPEVIYQNQWKEIVTRPAMKEMPGTTRELVDQLVRIGYEYSTDELGYNTSVIKYLNAWSSRPAPREKQIFFEIKFDPVPARIEENVLTRRNAPTFSVHYSYDVDAESMSVIAKGKGRGSDMNYLIPLPYVLLEILFLSLSLVLGMSFYYGFHGNGFIIGPWTHLMLLVGMVGLTATVFAGVCEWVYKQNVQKKQ